MQDFTNSSSTEFFIAVGMDVYKKTIARELVGFLWAALQLENPLSTTHVQA